MMIMRKKMNRLLCFLSGGHQYADINLRVSTDELRDTATFTNTCVKCGKAYEVILPYSVVLSSCLRDVYDEATGNNPQT